MGTCKLLRQLVKNAGRLFTLDLHPIQGRGEEVVILLVALFEGNFTFHRVIFLIVSLLHS